MLMLICTACQSKTVDGGLGDLPQRGDEAAVSGDEQGGLVGDVMQEEAEQADVFAVDSTQPDQELSGDQSAGGFGELEARGEQQLSDSSEWSMFPENAEIEYVDITGDGLKEAVCTVNTWDDDGLADYSLAVYEETSDGWSELPLPGGNCRLFIDTRTGEMVIQTGWELNEGSWQLKAEEAKLYSWGENGWVSR